MLNLRAIFFFIFCFEKIKKIFPLIFHYTWRIIIFPFFPLHARVYIRNTIFSTLYPRRVQRYVPTLHFLFLPSLNMIPYSAYMRPLKDITRSVSALLDFVVQHEKDIMLCKKERVYREGKSLGSRRKCFYTIFRQKKLPRICDTYNTARLGMKNFSYFRARVRDAEFLFFFLVLYYVRVLIENYARKIFSKSYK